MVDSNTGVQSIVSASRVLSGVYVFAPILACSCFHYRIHHMRVCSCLLYAEFHIFGLVVRAGRKLGDKFECLWRLRCIKTLDSEPGIAEGSAHICICADDGGRPRAAAMLDGMETLHLARNFRTSNCDQIFK